jgi:hypothetical protein
MRPASPPFPVKPMRYRIVGTNSATSAPVELALEAETEPAARAAALSMGVTPSSITPADRTLAPALASTPPAASTAPPPPRPAEALLVRLEEGTVVTVQLTSKPWKALLALSFLALAVGAGASLWLVARQPRLLDHPTFWFLACLTLAGLGLLGVLVARLGAWWYHR